VRQRSDAEKQSKVKRRQFGSVPLSAEEFREGFEALLRSALLFAAEREWIEAQRGHFAYDELSQRCF
jgi:hypothetical protein